MIVKREEKKNRKLTYTFERRGVLNCFKWVHKNYKILLEAMGREINKKICTYWSSGIHSSSSSRSPDSTFCSLRETSCFTLPSTMLTVLSFSRALSCDFSHLPICIFPNIPASPNAIADVIRGWRSTSASPIISSDENVSWSNTRCNRAKACQIKCHYLLHCMSLNYLLMKIVLGEKQNVWLMNQPTENAWFI